MGWRLWRSETEFFEVFFDDLFAEAELAFAFAAAFVGDGLEGVDVVEVDAFDFVDSGLDVAWDGDVDDEEGPPAALFHDGLDGGGLDDEVGRGGGGDEDIDLGEAAFPFVEADGLATHLGGEFDGAVVGAVGDDDAAGSAGHEALGAGTAHLARTDEHDSALAEVVDLFGEIDGDGTNGGGAALDGGFIADALADAEGVLEELIETAAGGSVFVGGFVGLLDLAEDLGLAEDHGVEAADDAEEVAGGFVVIEVVEDEGLGFGLGELEVNDEVAAEGVVSGAGIVEIVGGVDFDAIAGGEDDALGDAGEFSHGLEGAGKVGFGKGDPLPHLDGGGAVVQADAGKLRLGAGVITGHRSGDNPKGEKGEGKAEDGEPGGLTGGEHVAPHEEADEGVECPDKPGEDEFGIGGGGFEAEGEGKTATEESEAEEGESLDGAGEALNRWELIEEAPNAVLLQQVLLEEVHDAGDAGEGEGGVGDERDGGMKLEDPIDGPGFGRNVDGEEQGDELNGGDEGGGEDAEEGEAVGGTDEEVEQDDAPADEDEDFEKVGEGASGDGLATEVEEGRLEGKAGHHWQEVPVALLPGSCLDGHHGMHQPAEEGEGGQDEQETVVFHEESTAPRSGVVCKRRGV